MVCSATAVRDENCDSACMDRHPEEGFSRSQDVSSDRCDRAAGNVTSVSTVEDSNAQAIETAATAQIDQSEVVLHDLWFALSRQEQIQFGGQFSRMLLRAVEVQVNSSTNESEPKS